MGCWLLLETNQLGKEMVHTVAAPWPWWLGALAVAAVSIALLAFEGRTLGVSGGVSAALGLPPVKGGTCGADGEAPGASRWRAYFLIGLPLGGLLAHLAGGGGGGLSTLVAWAGSPAGAAALLLGGGILIGWGTRQAGGCTSGHGIVGCALARPASLLATMTFFATGVLAANLLAHLGGLR